MAIEEGEWVSIRRMIEKISGQKGEYFVTAEVLKRDEDDKLIWVAEFGDQPIPLVAFDYRVKYYDVSVDVDFTGQKATDTTTRKYAVAEVQVPKVGETVIIARELGVNRLPRCLGVLKGQNWIDTTEG